MTSQNSVWSTLTREVGYFEARALVEWEWVETDDCELQSRRWVLDGSIFTFICLKRQRN